jgi:hypothetical protein
VRELQDISAQGIRQIRDFAFPLDFKAAGGHLLRRSRLTKEWIPHVS